MLTALRSKASSWVIKILFLVLISSFGIWGVGDMLHQGGGDPAVAEIGSVRITGPQYMKEFHDQVLIHGLHGPAGAVDCDPANGARAGGPYAVRAARPE